MPVGFQNCRTHSAMSPSSLPTKPLTLLTPRPPPPNPPTARIQLSPPPPSLTLRLSPHSFKRNPSLRCQKKTKEENGSDPSDIQGMPPEFYDEEWQARQREKTKEWHAYRKREEEEEERKENEYREIGMRLKGYPEEEVRKAKQLVSSFIRAAEEVEEKIEEAAERGELTELVLMVIWNRLDLARRDEEKDVIRSLDLLYRRIETEILRTESSPAMRLLNELLNLYDGLDEERWLNKCRKRMVDTFPREDPYTVLVPAGFDHQSRIGLPPEEDEDEDVLLLRVDFVREVDALLREVRDRVQEAPEGLDPESVAVRLKRQEKQQAVHLVMALLELAVTLEW